MTTFEGPVKAMPQPAGVVFDFLSNFNHFEALLPPQYVKDWESDGDACRFSVEGVGEIGLRIVDREPNKTIKFAADGKTPFLFHLWVQLKELAPGDTRVKLTIKAELNPMLKMMVSPAISKFLDVVTTAIASYDYPPLDASSASLDESS